MKVKEFYEPDEEVELPKWLKNVPFVSDWCLFKGEIYYAQINFEESEKRNKAVFDLAYCATKSLNNIYLRQVVWGKKKFQPWVGYSKWS
jgi:hypothetical protein